MAKGIIYIMTTIVPGLIKIGSTGNFKQRMHGLEHNGYRNITGLQRHFAIEVEDYEEKEQLLHRIFEKSRVYDTELFALDVNLAVQLLSSFEGQIVYPKFESKQEVFQDATDNIHNHLIPDGEYTIQRMRQKDGKLVKATARIKDGEWTLLKGSILDTDIFPNISNKAKAKRATMSIAEDGRLLEDTDLGHCSPSFAGTIVFNHGTHGWSYWKDKNGNPVDNYRPKNNKDE